jgi:eukaryotic-like serine/threonine-protein kinase
MFNVHEVEDLREGTIVAGKYRISKQLGAGGMGVVFAADHIHLGEKVAIKFLNREGLANPEVVARFAQEARAAVKIKSEHVARILDVGTLETGAPFIIMEYLEGLDLSKWIEQRGALPVDQAIEFLLQACEAIAEAHALGIVHRDLKPANLYCIRRADGLFSVKVLDFGISKAARWRGTGPQAGITKSSTSMGSPLYMSPEQMASSRDVDARTDIWALGVFLYEILAGAAPFNGDTLPEICLKVTTSSPRPLRQIRPDVPEEVERVIDTCLQKDRQKRYDSVAELALALSGFGPERCKTSIERIVRVIEAAGLLATGVGLPPVAAHKNSATGGDTMSPPLGRTSTDQHRRASPRLWIAGFGIVALAAVLRFTTFASDIARLSSGTVASETAAPLGTLLPPRLLAAPVLPELPNAVDFLGNQDATGIAPTQVALPPAPTSAANNAAGQAAPHATSTVARRRSTATITDHVADSRATPATSEAAQPAASAVQSATPSSVQKLKEKWKGRI